MHRVAPKLVNVMAEVRKHLAQPRLAFVLEKHAVDEARADGIVDVDILHVLRKTGKHVASHDQYSSEFETWKYRIEGATADGRKIAVIASFTPDPPLPMPVLCVITVFALRKNSG